MNRYDDQWADVLRAEARAELRARSEQFHRAYRAARYFAGARRGRAAGGVR